MSDYLGDSAWGTRATPGGSDMASLMEPSALAGYALAVATPITTIDLFAGAGGLTAGFRRASSRFSPRVAVEFERDAAATYAANHPLTDVINLPIEAWVQGGSMPSVDVVVGGPPCQGFSALGKQDVLDARNFLWEKYAEVILHAVPKYFVVENVAQFLGSPQFRELDRRTSPGGSLKAYDVSAHAVLDSSSFGAPQRRLRTIVIGRHRDMPVINLPAPTRSRVDRMTVREALRGLPQVVRETSLPERHVDFQGRTVRGHYKTNELHVARTYRPISQARFRSIPPGGNRFDIPWELQPDCWRRHRSGSGDVMGRLRWDEPSVTIRTEFTKPEKGRYLHPEQHRAITLQEGARLQGFDDDYLWVGSKTSIARQIGNAVPMELGRAIGAALLDALV